MGISRLKVDLAFGAAVILLGLAAVLAFRSVQRLRSSADSVIHTERVLREIEVLDASVHEAETSQRGYLLTHADGFLDRFQTARAAAEEQILSLQSAVADNPDQLERLERVRNLLERRLDGMNRTIQVAQEGDFAAAAELVRSGRGQTVTDSIFDFTLQMRTDEFALLEERRTSESATAGGTILFVLAGGIAAILIVATSRQSLLQQLGQRERAEQALARHTEYLRRLSAITASRTLTYTGRMDAIVEIGADRLRAPIGVLARAKNGGYQFVAVHDRTRNLQRGTTLPADDPCLAPITAPEGPIEVVPSGATCFGGLPIRRSHRIWISPPADGHAVLAYLDTAEDAPEMDDGDREFLRLIAQWVTVEMERHNVRKELEEREERYRGLVESASDLIYTTDTEGHITYANPTAQSTVGYSVEQLHGLRAIDLLREDVRADMQQQLRDQLRKRVQGAYYEVPVVTREGREIWLGQNVQLLTAGDEVIGLQAVARDITGRVELERVKDEFVSVVSHELRTPLTSIRGSLGLLATGRMGTLDEKGQRMLEIAAHNTDRLVRLINDLLDIDKLDSGKAPLRAVPTDLARVVASAVEEMEPLATRSGVLLELHTEEATAPVDPDRILQLLTNLISNAVKYSEADGTVRIRMESDPGEVRITVEDEGRGIPADKLQSIFERFQQVDSSDSRQKGGTGLGLAIVRRIAEQHGGRVWVESEWGRGSRFTVALPTREAAAPPAAPLAAVPVGQEGQRCDVLVVEDDVDLARVITEMLASGGITSCHARDGVEALQLSATLSYDLLLLDPGLPNLDGFGLVSRLREDAGHRHTPVLVYTTSILDQAARDALRLGPTEFLTKTRHPLEALENRVRSILDQRATPATRE